MVTVSSLATQSSVNDGHCTKYNTASIVRLQILSVCQHTVQWKSVSYTLFKEKVSHTLYFMSHIYLTKIEFFIHSISSWRLRPATDGFVQPIRLGPFPKLEFGWDIGGKVIVLVWGSWSYRSGSSLPSITEMTFWIVTIVSFPYTKKTTNSKKEDFLCPFQVSISSSCTAKKPLTM